MNNINFLKILGLFLGSIFFLIGCGISFFNFAPTYLPVQFKNIMALVLILYGLYRIVVTDYNNKWEGNSNE